MTTPKTEDFILYFCKGTGTCFRMGNFAYFPNEIKSEAYFHLRRLYENKYEIIESNFGEIGVSIELWKRFQSSRGLDYLKLIETKSYYYCFESKISEELRTAIEYFREVYFGVGKVIELDEFGYPEMLNGDKGLEKVPWVLVSFQTGETIKRILNTIPVYRPSRNLTDDSLITFREEVFSDYYTKLKVIEALQVFANNKTQIQYKISREFVEVEDFEVVFFDPVFT